MIIHHLEQLQAPNGSNDVLLSFEHKKKTSIGHRQSAHPCRLTPGRTPSSGGSGRTCHVIWDVVILSRQAWHRLTRVPSKAVPQRRSPVVHFTLHCKASIHFRTTAVTRALPGNPSPAEGTRNQAVMNVMVNVLVIETSKVCDLTLCTQCGWGWGKHFVY